MSRRAHRLPWIAAVCALATLSGCGGLHSGFTSHMQRGEEYLRTGSLDKASVEFRNALQINGRSARARYLNGVVAERRGNLSEALGSYQAAVDLDPDNGAARAALGRMLVFGGAAARAIPILDSGLVKHPDDPALLTARGAARVQLRDAQGGRADAEHAVRVAPDDEDAVALLAALYQRDGEVGRAVDLVAASVNRTPGALGLRQVLAGLYLATHQEAKCEEQLKQLIALSPRELARRYELAALYQRSGDLDAAQHVLEAAVTAFPESNAAKLRLGDFLWQQRSPAQGEKVLRAFVAREPRNDELRLGLGLQLQRAGAADQAVATYREILMRDARSVAALTARDRIAAIEITRGRSAAAQALLAAALEQNPHDPEALLMRAQLALADSHPAAAIADLRTVLREQPNATLVHRLLARAYLANDETALAEETLRAALQSAPQELRLRIDLAQLLTQRGSATEAATLLEETVRQVPGDVEARAALVRAELAKHDLTAARTAAQDLKVLAPEAAVGAYLLGLVAGEQGHAAEARHEFERALQLQPGYFEPLSALTRLELARGDNDAALARVRTAATAAPADPAIQNLLGELLISSKAYSEATAQLTKTTRLAPRWALPYLNLARAQLERRDSSAARATYQAGLRQLPYEPALTFALAELDENDGQVDAAIALYEALHAHDPRLLIASNNLAMLLVTYRPDRGSLARASELTAGFAGSDSGALLDTHGWVRLKLGEVSDALTVLERAADRAPESRVIRYHLAMAQLQAGETEKARSNLQSALAGAASFAGMEEARAALSGLTRGRRS